MLDENKNQEFTEVQKNEGENIFGEANGKTDLGGEIDFGDFSEDGDGFNPFAGTEESNSAEDCESTQESQRVVNNGQADNEQEHQMEETATATAKTASTANESQNPFEAALSQAEEKQAQNVKIGLVSKPPVFSYASVKEDISDSSITFEALRESKAADFPELDDEKRVTWSVSYGKVIKTVSDAKKTTIVKMKSEIETSKEFLDGLKKTKGEVSCLVTPKVTAQKKGEMPAYRGVFLDPIEAENSGKPIVLLPAEDGNVYEVRYTDIGRFTAPTKKARGLFKIRAGLVPALPPLPFDMLIQIISFFKSLMNGEQELEALANIYWDTKDNKYYIHIPKQIVSKARVDAQLADVGERFIHVMDIHSHNAMKAYFSEIDDDDEKATRIYAVIGRLDKFFPDISARISVGGKFVDINPSLIFEGIQADYPGYWAQQIETSPKKEVCFL